MPSDHPKRILVRLPNWLGDMVMSRYFIADLQSLFPGAELGFIVKKGLEACPDIIPAGAAVYVFSKKEFKGLPGAIRFGRLLKKAPWDLFFCLPDSFSSAVMGWASGARVRIGYRKELREILLSNSYKKPVSFHRINVYRHLLFSYLQQPMPELSIAPPSTHARKDFLVLNINSEAVSRRWPVSKAVEILLDLHRQLSLPITLVGSPADRPYVEAVMAALPADVPVVNRAGTTNLSELTALIGTAKLMLSSDSGPAHLAGLTGTPLLVTFGAGDENETGPLPSPHNRVLRLGKLPCEPCRSNTCKLAKEPPCLLQLENDRIISSVRDLSGIA